MIVASYDRVRIDGAQLARVEWGLVVLDEAQYIKNHATKTTRAVKRLRSRLRFALTGTPVENRLSELWSIFDFLMPGFLGSYERFRERYELGIIGEDEEAAARLRALIEPFVLRRRKADVLAGICLARLREYPLWTTRAGRRCSARLFPTTVTAPSMTALARGSQERPDSGRNARVAAPTAGRLFPMRTQSAVDVHRRTDALRAGLLRSTRSLVFEELTTWRSLRSHAAIMELGGRGAMEAGRGGASIFSQLTSYLTCFPPSFTAAPPRISGYNRGSSPPRARAMKRRVSAVTDSTANETPVFLVSLKAGGTGLNLAGASAGGRTTDLVERGRHRPGDLTAVPTASGRTARWTCTRWWRKRAPSRSASSPFKQQAKRDLADSVIAAIGRRGCFCRTHPQSRLCGVFLGEAGLSGSQVDSPIESLLARKARE
ncbi:MAG: DEAD/DEAH box helicase [Adlercreutzia equolifaciens]